MIEIIGFWFGVSIMTVLVLVPVFWTAYYLLPKMASQITKDKQTVDNIRSKIIASMDNDNSFIIFNKFTFHEDTFIWSVFISICTSAIYYAVASIYLFSPRFAESSALFIDTISKPSEALASPLGWIAILIIVYAIAIKGLQKAYEMYKKVSKLLETK